MNNLSGSHNTHARLSPSSSKQWMNCTASLAMIEANGHRIPEDTSSAYSREGTEAHDWAAKVLLNQCTIGDVPEAFREYIQSYVDHCLALVPEGVSYQVEVQVPLFYQPTATGTCDFAIITDGLVVVRDYKHGAGVLVSAHENPQLAIYAMSLIRTLEDVYGFDDDTVVNIGIFQPRHREAQDAVPWVVTLKELAEFCADIERQAMIAFAGVTAVQEKLECATRLFSTSEILACDPNIHFEPQDGDDGSCRWCNCKAWCDARLRAMTEGMDLADIRGEDLLTLLPDLSKDEMKQPVEVRVEIVADALADATLTPLMLSDEYLVRVYAASKAIRRFLEDTEEYLEGKELAGLHSPGVKLVLSREGNRAWASEEAADTFLKGQGLKQDERYDYKLKSPTAIEKILDIKKKPKRTQTRFAELISRAPAKPTLALEGDKRESISAPVNALPDLTGMGNEDEDV